MEFKPSVCVICDESALNWIPQMVNGWNINYMFCKDKELEKVLVNYCNLPNVETNKTNDIFNYIDNLDETKIDVLFLALFTNDFHEQVLEYIIKKRKIFHIFSSNIPTFNFDKLLELRNLTNNFNLDSNIIYDVKADFKENNKQFFYFIFNNLLCERVFFNLQEMIAQLGHIYGVNVDCTFIPFLLDETISEAEKKSIPYEELLQEKEAVLFHRTILVTSVINFLFNKPKSVFARNYLLQSKQQIQLQQQLIQQQLIQQQMQQPQQQQQQQQQNISPSISPSISSLISPSKIEQIENRFTKEIVKCLTGYIVLDNMHCNFHISVSTPVKIFNIDVYGENGFITLSYNHEHNGFQIQRCLNNYEYPHLYVENAQQNSLNELKYFLQEKYCTNKYLNSYIDSIYIASCIWNSDGLNIPLKNLQEEVKNTNIETNVQEECISV